VYELFLEAYIRDEEAAFTNCTQITAQSKLDKDGDNHFRIRMRVFKKTNKVSSLRS